MANIRFASEEAWQRWRECREMSKDLDNSLDKAITRLMCWNNWDDTINITTDFDKLSFYFWETDPEGKRGICGGIIFHGKRDNRGDGNGPTFSVCLEPTDGYSIHT